MNRYKLRPIVLAVLILTSLLGAQTSLAILPLDAKGISDIEASIITDRLSLELSRTGLFTVLERGKMEGILLEYYYDLAYGDWERNIVAVGQLLGVEQILFSSIIKTGNTFWVIGRLFDAGSGVIVRMASFDQWATVAQLWNPGMSVLAQAIAGQLVEPARPFAPAADEKVAAAGIAGQLVASAQQFVPAAEVTVLPATRRGDIFFVSRLGYGHSGWGDTLSWGGQIGYGKVSGNKVWIDFLSIYDYSFNVTILYEVSLWRLFTQFGWGFVSDEEVGAFGYRLRAGLDISPVKFLLIRPSADLNLGFLEGQSSYGLSLDFGLKLPQWR